MNKISTDILSTVNLSEPVSDVSLAKLFAQLGKTLPSTYEDFLRFSNGVEGFLKNSNYLVLWPIEELIQNNQEYSTEEFAPGLLLIGSDGGEEAYGIDFRETSPTYGYFVEIPFIVMNWSDSRILGTTFT